MNVLIGCEYSGIVREAFAKRGHNAVSVDLLPTAQPGNHIQGDVLKVLDNGFDLAIFHPDCTYMCNSGALRLYVKGQKKNGLCFTRWAKMLNACAFFSQLLNAPISKIAVENPIMHAYAKATIGVQQTQIIQPYQFGHTETKATCLWLKNLPLLQPTKVMDKPEAGLWDNQTPSGNNKLGKGKGLLRAKTYQGIADAMAEQWG